MVMMMTTVARHAACVGRKLVPWDSQPRSCGWPISRTGVPLAASLSKDVGRKCEAICSNLG